MDYSKILLDAYAKFLLPLGGKLVPTPYRINIPFQIDRKKYGKSDPETLKRDVEEFAKDQSFNLEKASVEEIKQFMGKNQLGIDCSGFAYHILNFLLNRVGKGSMLKNGFPKASRTNTEKLTSSKFSIIVDGFENAKPGDLIKMDSEEEIPHILIILSVSNEIITYAHSGKLTKIQGVHQDKIKNGKFPTELSVYKYNEKAGDGIRRLKVLV